MSVEEDCIVCYNRLKDSDLLSCGHRVHISCIQQQFKAECPLCRAPLNIQVFGTKPEHDTVLFQPTAVFVFDIPATIVGNVVERNVEQYESEDDDREYRRKGYNYREEDSEYDEENPCGDNWSYDDY